MVWVGNKLNREGSSEVTRHIDGGGPSARQV